MDTNNKTDVNKKTRTMASIILGAIVLLVVLTISYAYIPDSDIPNEPIDATASTATLKLRYIDCDEEDTSICGDISAELEPGQSITKNFAISNVGTESIRYTIYFRELTNTFKGEDLVYKLENLTTGSEIVSERAVPSETSTDLAIAKYITSPVGTTQRYRITITFLNKDYNQTENLDAEFSIKLGIKDSGVPESDQTLAALNLTSNGVRTSFDEAATTNEGLFEMEDDYGTSYYFRGAVENNYVQFAGFYWRIIRVNGDGSLRIIYDGTSAHANGEDNEDRFTHTDQAYNVIYNDNKYVGWMYSPSGTTASTTKVQAQTNTESSAIKKTVDEWYKTNIVDKEYSSAVSDEIFCNDRSTPGKDITGWSEDTGLGYGTNATAYGAVARTGVWNSSTTPSAPTFKCPQKNDAFTVDDTEAGNGALTYPVGLITADEVVAAGSGKWGTINTSYYLYKGTWYWSLSPYGMYTMYTTSIAYAFYVSSALSNDVVNNLGAVAPVINLSAEYASSMKGTGSMSDPYRAA